MDPNHYRLILDAVWVCSNPPPHTPDAHKAAHGMLEMFKYQNKESGMDRMEAANNFFHLLDSQSHSNNNVDITLQTKLYALECLKTFIDECHSNFSQSHREAFRNRVLQVIVATFDASTPPTYQNILCSKFGPVLADLILRDFPQLWTTLFSDLVKLLSHSTHTAQIALQAMKYVVEDCTDSDFNSKISSDRRNDVLQGVHELSSILLTTTYEFIQMNYKQFLSPTSPSQKETSSTLIKSTLSMMAIFSQWMPPEWANNPTHDYVIVYMHLLRETHADIRIYAATCLSNLCGRKLDEAMFFRVLEQFPSHVNSANTSSSSLSIVDQLPFHRLLSEAMSHLVSVNVANISSCKEITNPAPSPKKTAFVAFLNLQCSIIAHPSPQVSMLQLNMWLVLFRDPQLQAAQLLNIHIPSLFSAIMIANVKLNYDVDVYSSSTPLREILEESWDDEDEYKKWLHDTRGMLSMLMRIVAVADPASASLLLQNTIYQKLSEHGSPPPSTPVTETSSSNLQIESLQVVCDNMLVALKPDQNVKAICEMLLSWVPPQPILIVRRITLLESMRHYWVADPSTLPRGIEAMLTYLTFTDPDNALQTQVRKKAGISLVTVSKKTAKLLVQHVAQLTEMSKTVLSNPSITAPQQMHIYEFLICVANAMTDFVARNSFVHTILSESIEQWAGAECGAFFASVESLLGCMGVSGSANNPNFVVNMAEITKVSGIYGKVFLPLSTLMSVGKRCEESSRDRNEENLCNSSVCLTDLSKIDPYVQFWPRILPQVTQVLKTTMSVWHHSVRKMLLKDGCMAYVLAMTDEEANIANKQASDNSQKGASNAGSAGSGDNNGVVRGSDRKMGNNLCALWPGWFNELRNAPFQMLGMCALQRAIYSQEIYGEYTKIVSILTDEHLLKSMENRHLVQMLKQFLEPLIQCCPAQLYDSHLSEILTKVFAHIRWRLECAWTADESGKHCSEAPSSLTASSAADDCAAGNGSDEWYARYYAYGGLFVGDLNAEYNEGLVTRVRTDLTHAFVGMLQNAFALSGSWALTLAHVAKESERNRKSVASSQAAVNGNFPVNPEKHNPLSNNPQIAKRVMDVNLSRIDNLGKFLLVNNEGVAHGLIQIIVGCLSFPDAYTCRRTTKLCHRLLEHCAHIPKYTQILGQEMFVNAVKNVVFEPRWMVSCEWDVIAVVRDIYCRLVLGQALLPLGQGPGQEAVGGSNNQGAFAAHKHTTNPREGGGILSVSSNVPRNVLLQLPGVSVTDINDLDARLRKKRSAKDQKDAFRDLLNKSAKAMKKSEKEGGGATATGIFGRALEHESVLDKHKPSKIQQSSRMPKLQTQSAKKKKEKKGKKDSGLDGGDLSNLF